MIIEVGVGNIYFCGLKIVFLFLNNCHIASILWQWLVHTYRVSIVV